MSKVELFWPNLRTKFYENADIHVSLEGAGADAETGAPTAVVMYRILKKVKAKIEATKEVCDRKINKPHIIVMQA